MKIIKEIFIVIVFLAISSLVPDYLFEGVFYIILCVIISYSLYIIITKRTFSVVNGKLVSIEKIDTNSIDGNRPEFKYNVAVTFKHNDEYHTINRIFETSTELERDEIPVYISNNRPQMAKLKKYDISVYIFAVVIVALIIISRLFI